MNSYKPEVLKRVCYTELVYQRINKKLNKRLSNEDIEKMIFETLEETNESQFVKIGKNIYVTNCERNIRITVNSSTYRIITVDAIASKKNSEPPTFG